MSFFEILFKYNPVIYEKGRLAFQLVGSPAWFIPFLIAAVAGAYFAYRHVSADKRSPGMIALRATTFAILAFIFLRPVLNVSTVLPQESYLAVIFDNSQSMNIRDDGQTSRAEQLNAALEETNFMGRLSEKFRVRTYRFDSEAQRVERPDQLNYAGTRTRFEAATDLLTEELATVPLSGVVLVTDGGDNASTRMAESLARLQSRNIPFYTVGVGSTEITQDAEIVKVSAPREMLKESTAIVDVAFRSHGLAGRQGTLYVRENGTLVKTEQVTLPRDGEIGEMAVELPVKTEGSRIFSFELQAQNDRIAENNTLDSLVQIRNDQPQILYVEGEPRWEFKYLRRALEDDSNIRLVTLLRSSQNKFYRQGIEREDQLEAGFPTTREELFAYKGIIFGSIESTFFTQEQLNMVVDFVSNRGGGFLMLGGRNSYSAGRYQNSPIADMMPVEMGAEIRVPVLDRIKMALTDYGRTNTLMKLNPDAGANVQQWTDLPPMTDFNRIAEAKPGAIVLARGDPESRENGDPILLAYQRYGRGRAMAFTSGSSWRWQMEMDSADQTHELFWKQTLRWLVNSTPDSVVAASDKDTYLPGEVVNLAAEVADKAFKKLNSARVLGRMKRPDGSTESLYFDWSGVQEGTYRTQLNAGEPGLYELEVEATDGNTALGSYKTAFQVQDRPVEFYNAALDERGLQNIAAQTNGRYYPLSRLGDVPDDAVYVDGESSFVEQKELWDVPFLFLLLCFSFAGEWFWRKKKGLA